MAIKNGEVYKCTLCGNIVVAVHEGGGDLSCCGEDMELKKENSVDAALEKHVPVIEKSGDNVTVKVGDVAHPMEEKHYIEWIELMEGNNFYYKTLKPGDAPEADFCLPKISGEVKARAYCNLHGLWISK